MYWGTCYGTYCRLGKLTAPESDFLLVSVYHVEEAKKKAFEGTWSDQARLAQRMPGYEWTKTFKALLFSFLLLAAKALGRPSTGPRPRSTTSPSACGTSPPAI